MVFVTHDCGWSKSIEFRCPKCNKKFNEKDSQTAIKNLFVMILNEGEKLEKVKARLTVLEAKIK